MVRWVAASVVCGVASAIQTEERRRKEQFDGVGCTELRQGKGGRWKRWGCAWVPRFSEGAARDPARGGRGEGWWGFGLPRDSGRGEDGGETAQARRCGAFAPRTETTRRRGVSGFCEWGCVFASRQGRTSERGKKAEKRKRKRKKSGEAAKRQEEKEKEKKKRKILRGPVLHTHTLFHLISPLIN